MTFVALAGRLSVPVCHQLVSTSFLRLRNSVSWPGQRRKPQPAWWLSPSDGGGGPFGRPCGKPNRSPLLHAELLLHLMTHPTPPPLRRPWPHTDTTTIECGTADERPLVHCSWMKPIGLHCHKTELYSMPGHKSYMEVLKGHLVFYWE